MKKVMPFQRNDFDAVKKLLIEGFSSKFKNDINENFFLLNNYGFVLKEDEKLLGFASIHVINKINRISCLIEDVVIDSNYRGKGLGKLLINHLIKFSKTLDSDKIILNSKESNTKFYEKLGFKKNLPKTDNFFKNCLMLPMNIFINNDDVFYICDQIKKFYRK